MDTQSVSDTVRQAERANTRKAILAAAIGNFITWFEFAAYGFLAVIIGRVFFPSDNPLISLMSTFAAFAVAFLMNPVGGVVFGRLGDRVGRKTILAVVIMIMSGSTFVIGVLPGYDSIGILAPIALVALRLLQGMAAGGEPAGAATFLVESAPRGRRAWAVSFWHCSSYLANATASALILTLHAVLSSEAMQEWGWRIPFIIAGPLGLIALYIRMKLSDTEEFQELKASGGISKSPVKESFRISGRTIALTAMCLSLQGAAFYFIFVYMETYLQSEVGFTGAQASTSTIITLASAAAAIFIFAKVADRVGRRPVLITGAVLLTLIVYPVFVLINQQFVPLVIVGHVVLGVCLAMFMAASGAWLVESFPTRVRYTGFSIGFNIAMALFGGTAPFIATYLINATGSSLAPSLLIVVTGAAAVVGGLLLKETAGRRLDQRFEAEEQGTSASDAAEAERRLVHADR